MTDYKHGDWYCKPANEEEAKEIVERAVASGAANADEFHGTSKYFPYGVHDGCVSHCKELGAKYTIDELRQKFKLPGERAESSEWNGEGLPPVGTVCIGEHEDVNNGNSCTVEILKSHENGIGCAVFWIDAPKGKKNLFWCSDFRPLRTEREKFVDAALALDCEPSQGMRSRKDYTRAIYDALQSGQLKAPTNEPG